MANTGTIKYKIGIDEVGRGPIAGPVCVCAFLMKDENFYLNPTQKLPKLRDSKKLTKRQREVWYKYLRNLKAEGKCSYAVSFVSPLMIDKFGIVKCIKKALGVSLDKVTTNVYMSLKEEKDLEAKSQEEFISSFRVLLDGGLRAPAQYVNQETFIKGDELHPVISMASIVAKVSRDRLMKRFANKYPEYGFDTHVGYGTRGHYKALKKHGHTPIHRKTFIH